jgi:hypothetical protein
MTADASDNGGRARRVSVAAFAALLLAACGGPGEAPEDEIRAWVDRGHEAAEAKDRGELVDMISPRYADARGNTREDIENLFRLFFLRTNSVALLVGIDEIEVFDGTAASVLLTVGMGATTESALGFDADAYRFALELERDADDWQLVSGRWGEIGGDLR